MRLDLVFLACLAFDGPPGPGQRAPEFSEHLVASAWQNASGTGAARETTTYRFFPGGAFEHYFASDHVEQRWGNWRVTPVDAGAGVLLLAETPDGHSATMRWIFLPIESLGDDLQIGELRFHAVPASARVPAPAIAGDGRLEVLQSVADSLTTRGWHRSGPGRPGDPDRLAFGPGGTFRARFETPECAYEGRYSFSWRAERQGELRLLVPGNSCGGFAGAHVRVQPFHFDAGNLVIQETVYQQDTPKEMKR